MPFKSDEQRKAAFARLRLIRKGVLPVTQLRPRPGAHTFLTDAQKKAVHPDDFAAGLLSGLNKRIYGKDHQARVTRLQQGPPGKGAKIGDWSQWLHAKHASGVPTNRLEKDLIALITTGSPTRRPPNEWRKEDKMRDRAWKRQVRGAIARLESYYRAQSWQPPEN